MLNRVAQSWRGASAHIRSLASKKFPASAESQPAGLADTGSATAPRLAIAHDYLTQRGGAERVVLALSTRPSTILKVLFPSLRMRLSSPVRSIGWACCGATTGWRCRCCR